MVMPQFQKLIDDALERGDKSDPLFRKSVYDALLNAFEKTAAGKNDPATFIAQYQNQVNDAIANTENEFQNSINSQNSLKPDFPNTSVDDVSTDLSGQIDPPRDQSQSPAFVAELDKGIEPPVSNIRKKPSRKFGSLVWLAIGGLAAVLIVMSTVVYFTGPSSVDTELSGRAETGSERAEGQDSSDTQPKTDTAASRLPVENNDPNSVEGLINIEIGKGYATSGEAKWLVVDNVGLLRDTSKEDIELFQWIVRQVPALEKHKLTVSVQARDSNIPFMQIQAVYSAAGQTTKNYVYVLNLAGGTVEGKGESGFPSKPMKETADGYFIFDVETQNLEAEANLQLILMPVLSSDATGSAFINRFSVEKIGQ